MQLSAIAPAIRQACPKEGTAIDALSVQLQVLHEELEPDRVSQMHLHCFSGQMQRHSYSFRTSDARSR